MTETEILNHLTESHIDGECAPLVKDNNDEKFESEYIWSRAREIIGKRRQYHSQMIVLQVNHIKYLEKYL